VFQHLQEPGTLDPRNQLLINENWFKKFKKFIRKITKKSMAFLIAQYLYCTNIIITFLAKLFHFITQKFITPPCRITALPYNSHGK
jgi:hypothetical protein